MIGDTNELGTWIVANAIKPNSDLYPTWTGSMQLPANTKIQWKCLKRAELNAANGVVWQGGGNNLVNTGAGTSVAASF